MSARLASLTLLSGGCAGPMSLLDRGSSHATEPFWLLLAFIGIPAVLYVAVAVGAALRARTRDDGVSLDVPPAAGHDTSWPWLLSAGGIVPTLVVGAAVSVSLASGSQTERESADVTIDVVAHRFWWEVVYPDSGVVTANEIRVPAETTVRLRLTSADVVHSFGVPRLHAQRDIMPGQITELLLRVGEPGVARGQCYALCGSQHALMGFEVVAVPRTELDAWIDARRAATTAPDEPLAARGAEVFRAAGCERCHRVRGVTAADAIETPGPDLTHVASRRTLGGARVVNDRANLTAWILDARAHQPGAMPPTELSPADLQALVRYLEGLE